VSKGLLLSRRKQYKEAIDCYFKALRFYEKDQTKFLDGISYVYSNLASVYEKQNQNKTAITYLEKSLFYLNIKNEANYRR
jgi:tetratricopeptide (TPR) repeat protein